MGRALPFVLILLFAIAAVFSLSVSYLIWKDVQHFNSTQTEKTEQGVAISQKDRGFTVTQHLFDITGEDAAEMLALCE